MRKKIIVKMNVDITHYMCVYKYLAEYEDPEVIIKYIYKYIYEILQDFKDIPHAGEFEDFHLQFFGMYFSYYKTVIAVSKEPAIMALFPMPIPYMLPPYKFSIKNFLIGIVGRLISNPSYLYGDPLTWNIGYKILLDKESTISTISTCQYILLENYSVFQIDEEHRQSLSENYLYVIYKNVENSEHQSVPPPESVSSSRTDYLYNNTDEEIQTRLDCWKEIYNREYDPRIVEACNKLFTIRAQKLPRLVTLSIFLFMFELNLPIISNKEKS